MVYTFDDAKAKERHKTQYFEMFGNRAIYHDGWLAGHDPPAPWEPAAAPPLADGRLGALRRADRLQPHARTWPPSNPRS